MNNPVGRSIEIADGYVAIGRLGAPWGVRGEVKLAIHTDFPERFQNLEVVYVGPDARPIHLLSSRPHKGHLVVLLEGYQDRTAAEALRGLWVQVPAEEVVPLPEGEHYIFDLIGVRVRTTDGRDLGQISDVLFTGANEVFLVEGESGQVLIPYIRDVVVAEDMARREILVEPVPGLLD